MKPRAMAAVCHWGKNDLVRVRCDTDPNDPLCVIAFYDSNTEEEAATIYLTPIKARRIAQRLIEIADYYDGKSGGSVDEEEII